MKVYLDDIRKTPPGWTRTYTAKETIELLKTGKVTELSLDHDLNLIDANDKEETGYDVLLWMEKEVFMNHNVKVVPKAIHLHTDNAVGKAKMRKAVEVIMRKVESLGE
jgi:hypothetical protein